MNERHEILNWASGALRMISLSCTSIIVHEHVRWADAQGARNRRRSQSTY